MAFEDHLADLDEAVAGELGTPAVLTPADGSVVLDPVRVILERPQASTVLDGDGRVAKAAPTLEVSVADVARLRKGDLVDLAGRRWEVAGAPTRPGDGRWWLADVLDRGPTPA